MESMEYRAEEHSVHVKYFWHHHCPYYGLIVKNVYFRVICRLESGSATCDFPHR